MAKKKKKKPLPKKRNPIVEPMIKRHTKSPIMKDRRTPKGGQRNKQKDILEDE